MTRSRIASLYLYGVAAGGILLWVTTTAGRFAGPASADLNATLINAAILLVLTLLSSVSPVQTRVGSTLTVSVAPLFGAILLLPPWAAISVAVLGTLDTRVPGRDIPWSRLLFNRGMYALTCGLPALGLQAAHIHSPQLAWYLALPILIFAITTLNVGMMSVALWLLNGSPIVNTARKVVASSVLTYIALPLVGYMIWALMDNRQFPGQLVVFLLYGPLLVYRASLHKQNRLDQWLRDSFIMQSRIVDKRDGQTFGHLLASGRDVRTGRTPHASSGGDLQHDPHGRHPP